MDSIVVQQLDPAQARWSVSCFNGCQQNPIPYEINQLTEWVASRVLGEQAPAFIQAYINKDAVAQACDIICYPAGKLVLLVCVNFVFRPSCQSQ
jgi:hypothetical protein